MNLRIRSTYQLCCAVRFQTAALGAVVSGTSRSTTLDVSSLIALILEYRLPRCTSDHCPFLARYPDTRNRDDFVCHEERCKERHAGPVHIPFPLVLSFIDSFPAECIRPTHPSLLLAGALELHRSAMRTPVVPPGLLAFADCPDAPGLEGLDAHELSAGYDKTFRCDVACVMKLEGMCCLCRERVAHVCPPFISPARGRPRRPGNRSDSVISACHRPRIVHSHAPSRRLPPPPLTPDSPIGFPPRFLTERIGGRPSSSARLGTRSAIWNHGIFAQPSGSRSRGPAARSPENDTRACERRETHRSED